MKYNINEIINTCSNFETTVNLIRSKLNEFELKKSSVAFKNAMDVMVNEVGQLEKQINDDINAGNKKLCVDCGGNGYNIQKETIPKRNYPPNLPDSGWVTEEVEREIKCNRCKGKGYLELKWV